MRLLAFVALLCLAVQAHTGCQCLGDECGCCVHIKIHKLGVDDDACLNITYNPEELSISLTLTLDGKSGNHTAFNKTVSAKNPDFCELLSPSFS